MKKLSSKQIFDLRKSGVDVKIDKSRKRKVVKPKLPVTPPPVEKKPAEDKANKAMVAAMLSVMKASEQNMNTLAGVVAEMAKPVPKKYFKCLVNRNRKSVIETIDVEEL